MEAHPPRWAEAMLQQLLRPADRESTTGDLLEEYLVRRAPTMGVVRADWWYIRQVLGILSRAMWPGAVCVAAQGVLLALTVFRPGHHAAHQVVAQPTLLSVAVQILWYGSIVGTPGISMLDAAVYFFTAYRGAARTGLATTGMLVAVATSVVGFCVLFIAAAAITPTLALALFGQPSLVLIVAVYLVIPLAYSALVGAIGGFLGWWAHSRLDHLPSAS